jgi:hypothetical protein
VPTRVSFENQIISASLDHELKSTAREKGELITKEALLAEIISLKAEIDSIRKQARFLTPNEEPSERERTESP